MDKLILCRKCEVICMFVFISFYYLLKSCEIVILDLLIDWILMSMVERREPSNNIIINYTILFIYLWVRIVKQYLPGHPVSWNMLRIRIMPQNCYQVTRIKVDLLGFASMSCLLCVISNRSNHQCNPEIIVASYNWVKEMNQIKTSSILWHLAVFHMDTSCFFFFF